ncbi:arginase [uncultured Litoreibacter sp.]|uniref:arginase n=1 Tax=uncultured Litoreibacter sp. TaxID=1392394 RepID=UPI0026039A62|nr:arginase [uncultured Litoreibacter sp.]
MTSKSCILIGAPVQSGASQPGCIMGPDAFRTAGLAETLRDLGHHVSDKGNVSPDAPQHITHANPAIHDLPQTVAWAQALEHAAFDASQTADMPIFLGGDHSLSIGTVPGVARYWADQGRPLFVLWLDAHPDFHSLNSTTSGNLHGTPVAYFSGQPGFEAYPQLSVAVEPANLCMLGIRSVDPAENAALSANNVDVSDMRAIDEHGITAPLRGFLERVRAANGALHVSLDVDFLDPAIAPAVGTTVPGGATFREAHLVMEMLCDSDLVTSLDLVELNPFLDERGRTANLMVDLCASLMGRKVLDRQTRSL